MKIYKLPALSETRGAEYLLGENDLETRSLYMLYGRLMAGEDETTVKPKSGFEEILMVLNGILQVTKGGRLFNVSTGEAFHIKAGEKVSLKNTGKKEAVYITAGGRAGAKP